MHNPYLILYRGYFNDVSTNDKVKELKVELKD